MISADIIADSIAPNGKRLTTFKLVFPRIVLAEFNTHRMISKNSASSRAIPHHKMLQMVQDNPFIPIRWMKEHKGMQGSEYLTSDEDKKFAEIIWLQGRNAAVEQSVLLSEAGVTKQITNRMLEPYMWHTVICTGTEWENFFALRAHPAAEIHIAELAYRMLDRYNTTEPKKLAVGEWHVPFGENFDEKRVLAAGFKGITGDMRDEDFKERVEMTKVKIATARCARVSYLNFEGKDDYEADLKLHDMLAEQGHWSPFEHCAKAAVGSAMIGNFKGFVQYRKFFEQENKVDERVMRRTYVD